MSTETPTADVKPIRLSERQTEMLLKALMAEPQPEAESIMSDTQFIRLRLGERREPSPKPAPAMNVFV